MSDIHFTLGDRVRERDVLLGATSISRRRIRLKELFLLEVAAKVEQGWTVVSAPTHTSAALDCGPDPVWLLKYSCVLREPPKNP